MQQLPHALTRAFDEVTRQIPGFRPEQFRGDRFQAVISPQPELALRALILLHALLHKESFGIRIALGLGETSDGTAFRASGTALDEIKKRNQPVTIVGHSESFNKEWKVHALSLSHLLQRWTVPQTEAVLAQLQGLTQEETARALHVKQPAVQQRLQATGWVVMDAILERFVTSVLI
jgi:hypothetical protein